MLNPIYQACLRGLPDGVYRIRDLAPDAFFKSEYYRSYRVRPRASEEIGYITEHWPEGPEEIHIAVTLEPEVVQLILRGHSSESICFNLGISLGTVKTHRRNAYAKLKMSSQSELLSLFLRSLQMR